ncbi:MAG TPA: hypothetical protein ENI26_11350 [Methylophaga aminisulfidivorans]|uniref:Lipopeptide n=1 Tax=Methylophaga aminisulfidivorans TaxID=230105 RepID=A0A7C1VQ82_9GAMM|nr:hypothetical protein [Methylophaga aminisulfidivorans]
MSLFSCLSRLALVCCVLMTLSGCGQTGDLYMPESEAKLVTSGQ